MAENSALRSSYEYIIRAGNLRASLSHSYSSPALTSVSPLWSPAPSPHIHPVSPPNPLQQTQYLSNPNLHNINGQQSHKVDGQDRFQALRKKILMEGLPEQSPEELEQTKVSSKCSLRGMIWKLFLGVKHVDAASYIALVNRGASCEYDTISMDLGRTFKHDEVFESVVSIDKLSRCLNAFVHCCPEIGYVQGMNALCGIMLYVMPEVDAFFCFLALIRNHCMQYMIGDLPGVHTALELLGKVLQTADWELYMHLKYHHYEPPFLMPAILSLGAATPPLTEVIKLWDFYMAFGIHMNVICTAARIILMRDELIHDSNPCLKLRLLPDVNADNIISMAIVVCSSLPQPLYDMLVRHPYAPVADTLPPLQL